MFAKGACIFRMSTRPRPKLKTIEKQATCPLPTRIKPLELARGSLQSLVATLLNQLSSTKKFIRLTKTTRISHQNTYNVAQIGV